MSSTNSCSETNVTDKDLENATNITNEKSENAIIVTNEDSENATNNQSATDKYNLCGYLTKHGDKIFVGGLKSRGTITKKKWFVYSDATCKLYYYKSEKDPEPLGEIDIALSSLSYNEDIDNNGLFTISSGGKDYILEAPSPQMRMYWLQNLQNARREFNERLNLIKFRSSGTSIGVPESGLLQESNPFPQPVPDPHYDLIAIMNKSMDSSLKTQREDSSPKISKPNLNLPLKLFKTSNFSSKQERLAISNITPESSPNSPCCPDVSPAEINHFDKLNHILRTSFRLTRQKFTKPTADFSDQKCLQRQEDLNITAEEVSKLRDKCDAYEEALHLLQKKLDSTQRVKSTFETLINNSTTDEAILVILREKDKQIVELEHSHHQLRNTLSSLTSDLRKSRIHNEHLQEKVALLTSRIESKDNAIVDLSKKAEELGSSGQSQWNASALSSSFCCSNPLSPYPRAGTVTIGTQTTILKYEDLNDKIEGYKCQNTFLNKEILELNLILKRRNEREHKLISESSNWEAKFYQIQSKYLLLLNDFHSPQSSQHDSSVLSQLLRDVVDAQGTTDLRVVQRGGGGYDEYGFRMTFPSEMDILSKAEFLQKRSKTNAWLAEHQKNQSTSVDWESFLAGTNARELPQHPELKYLIREGIPYQYKGRVWRLLIESQIGRYKSTLSPTYYEDLLALRTSASTLDPSAKQIELDLLRTMPNNRHYESPYSDGIPKLRRVLLAYSRRNLAVGYCQGLNRLGAIALLFLNEDDAFWCLVYIIEHLMPQQFYAKNLLASQVDQRVLKDLISEKLPRLHSHFEQHELDISLFTFNWFLCIYVDAIPPSTYLYIWDSFLYEGSKVLFRFAIAIFKLCEEDILGKKDCMAIFDYLRSVPEQVANRQRLQQIAFQWANPLSMKYIRNRREHHEAIVKAELEKVEEVRKSYHQTKKEANEDESEKEVEEKDDDDALGERGDTEEGREVTENEEDKEETEAKMKEKFTPLFSEMKGKFREINLNRMKRLGKDCEKKKYEEKYTSVKLVPKEEVYEGDFDDEHFEVITLKRDSSSDIDEETS